MSTYIIADTHGCLLTLRNLLEDKIGIGKEDRLFFLGDYIDRGSFSAQLIEYIINLRESGFFIRGIRGNHEQMLLDARFTIPSYDIWMHNDGRATLESYREMLSVFFKFPIDLPDRHLAFFERLPYYIELDDKYLLVHGGINFKAKDPMSDIDSMLWSRPQPIPESFMPGKVLIYGHTTTPLEEIERTINNEKSRMIPLDAGCVYGGRLKGLGYLVALKLEDMSLFSVKKCEI